MSINSTQPTVTVAEGTYSYKAGFTFSSGDSTILTPSAGKALRLFYYMVNGDSANTVGVTATLKFNGGSGITNVSIPPGATLARNIGAGKYYFQGAADQTLVLNLVMSIGSQTVNWALEYLEV